MTEWSILPQKQPLVISGTGKADQILPTSATPGLKVFFARMPLAGHTSTTFVSRTKLGRPGVYASLVNVAADIVVVHFERLDSGHPGPQ